MKGIVYTSRSSGFNSTDLLKEMVQKAGANNQKYGITGFIYFDRGQFLQYIEGEAQEVEQLFDNIQKDKRHELTSYLTREALEERAFGNWSMRSIKRPDLIALGMESMIIETMLMFNNSSYFNQERRKVQIWRMVQKLSNLKRSLKP